jgi:probable F420-dependent oxidoreductase
VTAAQSAIFSSGATHGWILKDAGKEQLAMKIAILVPHSMHLAALTQPWEYGINGDQVGQAMTLADEAGFYKCMLGEHFIIPKDHLELSGDHYFHTVVALGVIGGRTKRLRLCPSVSIISLQNPIVQAKAWSSLDWMTGGRAEAMFGVGWLKEEFDLLGVPFHERGKMTDEYAAAMIELWTKENPAFDGKYVKFHDVGFAPKPVQRPRLPMWFGGDAKPVLKRVAKFGDGWSPQNAPPETIRQSLDFIKSQPEYDGRPLGVFFAMDMLNIGKQHEVLDDPRAIGTRNVQQLIDQIGWLGSFGVTETSLSVPREIGSYEAYLDWIRWVGAEIIPKVR